MKHTNFYKSIPCTASAVIFLLILFSCEQQDNYDLPAGPDGWLTGTAHEKFGTLASHHQGFSRTMMEIGYRYVELYWAGEDENWEFADYQLEHILEALEQGLERRPARRGSAEPFVSLAIPEIQEAITQRDQTLFRQRFEDFTTHCNACHAMEAVSFIHVHVPKVRTLPWGAPFTASP